MWTDNLDLDLDPKVAVRGWTIECIGMMSWPARWGILYHMYCYRLLYEMAAAPDVPGRFVGPDMLRDVGLLEAATPSTPPPAWTDWQSPRQPSAQLRAAYYDFATELAERHDTTQLVETI
ncbi:hypothetical protein [Mycobacterium leprae]|nr:hypothetical protein [Mycobacterium leprae]